MKILSDANQLWLFAISPEQAWWCSLSYAWYCFSDDILASGRSSYVSRIISQIQLLNKDYILQIWPDAAEPGSRQLNMADQDQLQVGGGI